MMESKRKWNIFGLSFTDVLFLGSVIKMIE